MITSPVVPYRVEAYNTHKESENKIHDDATARRFGFQGGLVPGVDVYGYMTHLPVTRWGRDWLARGQIECRFLKPVYDGEAVIVGGTETSSGLDLTVESHGIVCATGHATLPAAAALPSAAAFHATPEAARRVSADEVSLAVDTRLGIAPFTVTPEFAATYLRDLRETALVYGEAGLVHPGTLLRLCNWALSRNVILGPWIHVGSRVQHLALAAVGATLELRARVVANYERKGHRFVDLDVLIVGPGDAPISRVAHTAIYRPRQVVAAE